MAKEIGVDMMDMWHKTEPKLTIAITGLKEFRFRIWIASRPVALACRIGHMGFDLETKRDEADA